MSLPPGSKGKKRAVEEDDVPSSSASTSTTPEPEKSARALEKQPAPGPAKKSKRAEIRHCPVCDEPIPIRLLGKHAQLENERLDAIIGSIGSMEVLDEAEPDDGFTARTRRSALKARQHLRPGSSSSSAHPALSWADAASLERTEKTLRAVKRSRKQRHARLRELAREDDDGWGAGVGAGWFEAGVAGTACPVCGVVVRGDADVVEAHVDACLAHARLVGEMDVDAEEGGVRGAMEGVSFRGTGFDVRNREERDVEDEVDVDGEDEATFGAAQFSERDVLAPPLGPADSRSEADTDADIDVDDANGSGEGPSGSRTEREPKQGKSLRDLVAEGKVIRPTENTEQTVEVMGLAETDEVDLAIELARRSEDSAALVRALESKVRLLESAKVSSSTSLLCRICLDPYNDPTVSTGCWHTCCRECWLRCLGSTKLCPICKRITGATDLRRVYL
ncbi:uncharacterized protein BXZ73DRAFT_97278 [Epithele typhae]|uniref:uncharacterized protein n=1 Tax=Epithele typhae TaxID=378194 RepID=UPI00200734D2|nr:uncharacterized protein BXZ73DRAFT_97278 [Epithele typhae]KAH9943227.1 hypothetical protein BXZ73DRAFT_97278 [Epithele typhae]